MQIIGVDLHTRQQTVALFKVETGEIIEKTLPHEGDAVREFYSTLAGPTRVGIEASGSMQWFLELMEESGVARAINPSATAQTHGCAKENEKLRQTFLTEPTSLEMFALPIRKRTSL